MTNLSLMRTFSILIFTLFCSVLRGQSKWDFGIHFYGGLTGQSEIQEQVISFGTRSDFHEFIGNLPSTLGGAGVWMEYEFEPRAFFSLGLQYTNSGSVEFTDRYLKDPVTGERTSFLQLTYQLRVHQIQLPLEFRKEFGKGRLQPTLSVGAQLTYDILGRIFAENASITRGELGPPVLFDWSKSGWDYYNYTPLNAQLITGGGLRLNEKMRIELKRFWFVSGQMISWSQLPPNNFAGLLGDPVRAFWLHPHEIRSKHRNALLLQLFYTVN